MISQTASRTALTSGRQVSILNIHFIILNIHFYVFFTEGSPSKYRFPSLLDLESEKENDAMQSSFEYYATHGKGPGC